MNFPLELRFKLLAIASQISVRDATGSLICYVKQRAFKLKEAVTVYADEAQTRPLYTIGADRILDISAEYHVADKSGQRLGTIKRHGMRSLWRAHYDVLRGGQPVFSIEEENPWVKLVDGLLGEIPLVGILTGYFLHPAYRLTATATATAALRVVKQPALFEGVYRIERLAPLDEGDELLAVLAVLMMVLLERQRG